MLAVNSHNLLYSLYCSRFSFVSLLISSSQSRSEVELTRTFVTKHSRVTLTCVPIFAANMDTTGTFEMANAFAHHKACVALHKMYTPEEWFKWAETPEAAEALQYVAVSAGTSEADFEKVKTILAKLHDVRMICLDVANGYTELFVNAVRQYRKAFPEKIIIAGNVVTCEMVEELVLSGADIVKIGIGPGSVCTTRSKTGVGYPQLSASIECADAAHGIGGLIIADGGCTTSGDIAKAFGTGADFVMLGGMLSAHNESGGNLVEVEAADGTKTMMKEFYGMSSAVAMNKHYAGVASYRAAEGKAVLRPSKGPVEATLLDVLGGIRSACSYVGAATLKEMSKRTTFVRVTQQTNDVFGNELHK